MRFSGMQVEILFLKYGADKCLVPGDQPQQAREAGRRGGLAGHVRLPVGLQRARRGGVGVGLRDGADPVEGQCGDAGARHHQQAGEFGAGDGNESAKM